MIKKPLFIIFLALFTFGPFVAFAAISQYDPFVVLPYVTPIGGNKVDVTNYIPGLIKLTIALAGALAVIMIMYGGFQYVTSDGFGKTSDAKEKIKNALFGLLLAIGAYTLLNTLNPKLVDLSLDIKKYDVPAASSTPINANEPTAAGCSGCVYVQDGVDFPQKPPGSGCAMTLPEKKCQVNQALVPKLRALNMGMISKNVLWHVTEMFPPTVQHKSACHMLYGTCVDAALYNASHENIKKYLIEITRVFGNNFIYEVPNSTRLKELQSDPNLSVFKSFFINTGAAEHAHIIL